MVESEILPSGILVLRPSGPISTDDIEAVREAVDAHLTDGHELAGLLIEAEEHEAWDWASA